MNEFPTDVHDLPSAEAFIQWCVLNVGRGYHPDTPFSEYVDQDGIPCFPDDEAELLDSLIEKAFRFCDPYAIGLAAFQCHVSHDDPGRPQPPRQ